MVTIERTMRSLGNDRIERRVIMAPRNAKDHGEDERVAKLRALGLYGLIVHFEEIKDEPLLDHLIDIEEKERKSRSLERRVKAARCGRFKSIADFDWAWPRKIDREHVDELFRFHFLVEGANVVFVGPNGVGKTTLAQNLAYEAVIKGHTVRFTSASQMLGELVEQDSPSGLQRRLRRYVQPSLLVVDEVGYLSYDSRHADLLFEIVNRREDRSTIVTTNRAFSEWAEVFPNSSSVVALVDRLVHKAEVLEIDGDSYRRKEAEERKRRRTRPKRPRKKDS
jgi:DNA replication protein DnaC